MYTAYVIYNKIAQKLHIGQTIDLEARLEQHNAKAFRGYTARFDGKWVLIYSEEFATRQEVLVREKQLKSFQGRQFIKRFIPGVPPVGGSAVEPG